MTGFVPTIFGKASLKNAPNLVWVSDITYLRAGGKWYYLCVVIDLFSRKVIAWHLSSRQDARAHDHCFSQSLCSTVTLPRG